MRKRRMLAFRRGQMADVLDIIVFTFALLWIGLNMGRMIRSLDEAKGATAVEIVSSALNTTDSASGAVSVLNSVAVGGDTAIFLYDCESLSKESDMVLVEGTGDTENVDDDILTSIKTECDAASKNEVVMIVGRFENQKFEYVVHKFETNSEVTASLALGMGSHLLSFDREGGLGEGKSITVTRGGQDGD